MSSPDPKFVLTLAADIVAAREQLAKLQEQWDSLFAPVAPPPARPTHDGNTPATPMRTRGPNSNSLSARIVSYLDADPTCHYDAAEIGKALGEDQDKVQKSINKLVFQKKIGRYSRGLYESIIEV